MSDLQRSLKGPHIIFILKQRYAFIPRSLPIILLLICCASPIDYFGNEVDINTDRIFLIKMRKDRTDKDQYTLIFVEQRGDHSKNTKMKRQKTLERYVDLIKSFYGYTEHDILDERERGIIEPRYYVTVKFN
ncbi:MAG: hypothetical protein QF780_08915 [Candidatus Marinimicrobia bacterium]|nr:hypothetical protein [Candidatus Neomarinimicrobiota bacterium]